MANRILTTMLSAAAGAGGDTYWSTEFKQDSGLNISYNTIPCGLTVDSNDNIYVGTHLTARPSGCEKGTGVYKFDTETGGITCYNQIGRNNTRLFAMNVDNNDCLYVTGEGDGDYTNFIARYNSSLTRDWITEQAGSYKNCGSRGKPCLYGGVSLFFTTTVGYGSDANQRPALSYVTACNGTSGDSVAACAWPANSSGIGDGVLYMTGGVMQAWTVYNGTDTRIYTQLNTGTPLYSLCMPSSSGTFGGQISTKCSLTFSAGGWYSGTVTQGLVFSINNSSTPCWALSFCSSSENVSFYGTTYDSVNDAVYAYGYAGDRTYPYTDGNKGLLASIDASSGSLNWIKRFCADVASRDPYIRVGSADVDSRGNIIISGDMYDEFQAHTSNAPKQGFVMKLPSSGNFNGTYGNISITDYSGYSTSTTLPTRAAAGATVNTSNPYDSYCVNSGFLVAYADCYEAPCYTQTTII